MLRCARLVVGGGGGGGGGGLIAWTGGASNSGSGCRTSIILTAARPPRPMAWTAIVIAITINIALRFFLFRNGLPSSCVL